MTLLKAIFWIHLAAGLVILVMSVTGVLFAYQRQITPCVRTPARRRQ